MVRRIIFWGSAWFVGFYTGAGGLPKGLEFQLLFVWALATGLYIGRKWGRRRGGFTVFGYEVRRRRQDGDLGANGIQLPPKVEKALESPAVRSGKGCEVCRGEVVTLAGQKIACPKCKGKVAQASGI